MQTTREIYVYTDIEREGEGTTGGRGYDRRERVRQEEEGYDRRNTEGEEILLSVHIAHESLQRSESVFLDEGNVILR